MLTQFRNAAALACLISLTTLAHAERQPEISSGRSQAAGADCLIVVAGDVNVDGMVTSADIIVLVNFVFKSTGVLLPCLANGDVNCNNVVTSADIIDMLHFVFKSNPSRICDICAGSGLAASCQ